MLWALFCSASRQNAMSSFMHANIFRLRSFFFRLLSIRFSNYVITKPIYLLHWIFGFLLQKFSEFIRLPTTLSFCSLTFYVILCTSGLLLMCIGFMNYLINLSVNWVRISTKQKYAELIYINGAEMTAFGDPNHDCRY